MGISVAGERKVVVDGTHRLVAAETTWARVRPLLPHFGITRVADVTGLDDLGIPTFISVRPNAKTLSVSQGKGLTSMLARVSAAMEAIELWHAENPPQPVATGGARAMGLDYDVLDLQRPDGSLLTSSAVLGWLPAARLLSGAATLVPLEYVVLSNVVAAAWSPPLLLASSNGLASGNSLSEAALHGLYEVIERDCVAQMVAQPLEDRRRVDLASVGERSVRSLLDRLADRGNWVELVDATNHCGVPCYTAHLWSPALPRIFSGAGCHLDPSVAATRALTEAAQSRLTVIAGTREDIDPDLYPEEDDPRVFARPERLPPTTAFRDAAATATIDGDLSVVAGRVRDGYRVDPLLVDLTREEFGVPVAKVVVPGMRFDPAHGIRRVPHPDTAPAA
jgi:ribosomal protein S12 methylthiotransferase accessory factor